jgi:magnesium transporter
MNFEHMPELHWKYGYPVAVGMMVVVCAYLYYRFRKSGWL